MHLGDWNIDFYKKFDNIKTEKEVMTLKITTEQITEGQDEIIVRYRERTEEIESLLRSLEQRRDKIYAEKDGMKMLIIPSDVLYLERVDSTVYIYTKEEVAKTDLSLASAEGLYADDGFFRSGKSMVINIYHIEYLKSISGNRVDVTMDNGEHVIISRRYVKALRSILKGESE